MKDIDLILGPRVPKDVLAQERRRYMLPSSLIGAAAALLLVSIFLPYWQLTLRAPQYPEGLKTVMYVNHVSGDVDEINHLNHYIGMRPLQEAASLERASSVFLIVALTLLTLSTIFVHSPMALFCALPAVAYPAIFMADLYFWMRNFGLNLDPKAPLSSAVKPFVPPLLGVGNVGQFRTEAVWETGLFLAIAASVLVVIGLYFHRRAYKPLLEQRLANNAAAER
ncbi:MAG TPA: cytochrome C [Candidatus Krumholzibacteria bacterium]|nr:cytochrome C [Candidatus Krumholzibacteria bacterium]